MEAISTIQRLYGVIILFAIFYGNANGQYSEPFSTANKGYKINLIDDFTTVNWSLSAWDQPSGNRDVADYFNTTAAGKLECIDLDQVVYWESPLINTVAANPVSIKMDLTWIGFDTDVMANDCSTDYIRVEYSVNGGAYVMIPNVAGGNACATVSYPYENPGKSYDGSVSINHINVTGGSTLKIRVKVFTNANAELVTIDNVAVPEAGVFVGCAAPVLSTVVTPVGCSNPNSGAIDLSVSAGTPGYTYLWSNGATTQDLTNKPIGTYTVTVTDAASCTATTSATISNAPAIVLATQVLDVSCSGIADGEIGLDVIGGVPGYTYDWSNDGPETPDNDTKDLIGVGTGTYTVTVTDVSGCTATKTATIAVQPVVAYNEQFNVANKGYLANYVDDFAAVDWTMSGWSPEPPAPFGRDAVDFFRTSGGVLLGEDFDQDICWTSPLIDLNTGTQFSVKLVWTGFDVQSDEYINVKYSINGGAYITLGNAIGGGAGTIQYAAGLDHNDSITITKAGLSGSTIQIQICAQFNSNNESMTIDNVSVPNSKPYCPCTPPTFTSCPSAPVVANNALGQCNATVNYTVVATGNPSPTYTYVFSGATTGSGSGTGSGSTFLKGNTLVTVTATNACGAPTCVFTVTVNDTELPQITCPSNQSSNNTIGTCGKVMTFTPPVGTDNCTGQTTTQTSGLSSGSTFPVGVTTNTFRVTDASSNSATCSFTITINDSELPQITCPGNQTASNTIGICGKIMTYTPPVGTDNCAGQTTTQTSGLSSGFTFPVGVTTNTFRVTDASGNTATCSFTITINDTELPQITCPGNQTASNTIGICGKIMTYTVPVGTDNCAGQTTTQTAGLSSGSTFPVGVTTNTFRVTDASGNTATCSFTITINDTEFPLITCPGNQTANNTIGTCSKVITYTTPVGTDNCAGQTTTQTAGLPSGSTFPLGATINTFRVTDAAGFTASCFFSVTIVDAELPQITCPGNQSSNITAGTCGKVMTYTPPVGTDNCSGPTTVQTAGLASGSTFPVGVTTNTYRVTDASGNTTTCSFTITILDNELPQISCPGNQTANNTMGICGKAMTYTAPVGTDNCSGQTTTQTSGLPSGSTFPVGVTTNTFRVTDASGNTATCSFTITISDTELPQIACPGNQTANNGTGLCGKVMTFTIPAGTDNCAGQTTTQTSGLPSGSTFPVGMTTNTFKVTDAAGNTATCSFTISIVDAELPQITCPSNQTENNTIGTCSKVTTFNAPIGTDNCSGQTTAQTAGLASGSTFPVGVTTNTFKVTDAVGNTATCSFTISIVDAELPQITCPGNQTANNITGTCGRVMTYTPPVGTDNCAGQTTIQTAGLPSGSTFPGGVTTNTFKVTDASGNSTTCSFTITINDIDLPLVACKGNQHRVAVASMCTYTTIGTEFDPISSSDNCAITATTYTMTGVTSGSGSNSLAGFVFNKGITTVTWNVTDAAGNSANCNFNVRVTDNENPRIVCKTNQTRGTDPTLCKYQTIGTELDLATKTDNCSVSTTSYVLTGATTGTGNNSLVGFAFNKGLTTILWTVTDAAGNSSACSNTVTVIDDDVPNLTCKANQTRGTSTPACKYTAVGAEFNLTSSSDNCGVTSTIYTLSGATSSTGSTSLTGKIFNLGVTTVVWKVSDAYANMSTCSFTVTINDNSAPTMTCKANQVRSATAYTCNYTTVGTEFNLSASNDNCGITSTTYTLSGVTSGTGNNTLAGVQFNKGISTIQWKVTDAAGNTKTCSFTVTVNDIDSDCDGVYDCTDVCPGGDDTVDNDGNTLPDCKYPPTYALLIPAWKCGTDKAYICHSGITQCVNYSLVAGHIAHGDYLGPCDNASCGGWSFKSDADEELSDEVEVEYNDHVQELGLPNFMEVFPNPARNKMFVTLPKHGHFPIHIQVYNSVGKQMFNEVFDIKSDQIVVPINVLDFPSGLYFVKATIDGIEQVKTISIIR